MPVPLPDQVTAARPRGCPACTEDLTTWPEENADPVVLTGNQA